MESILKITQIIFALLLSLSILLQNRGGGLGSVFGGGGEFYASKRGLEKILAKATVILAIAFFTNALAFIFV